MTAHRAVSRVLTPRRFLFSLGGLAVLLVGTMAVSLLYGGAADLRVGALLKGALTPMEEDLFHLRAARVLIGAVAGGVLGGCGVILQALLRNPLAYPHILGISGGAAVGGIAAQLFGFSTVVFMGVTLPGGPAVAFASALATTFLIFRAASLGGSLEPVSLILVGVVFNSFAGALILFFFALSDSAESRGVLYWMVGSLEEIDLSLVGWVSGIALCGSLLLAGLTPALNVLSQGEEVAANLGVPVVRVRRLAFVGTSVVVGSVVSICGMIGFVGLIIPHLLRIVLGPDHRLLFPASLLGGGAFLVFADFLARNLIYPEQIPVGVLTAFCGGPFFLFLLRRYHRMRYF